MHLCLFNPYSPYEYLHTIVSTIPLATLDLTLPVDLSSNYLIRVDSGPDSIYAYPQSNITLPIGAGSHTIYVFHSATSTWHNFTFDNPTLTPLSFLAIGGDPSASSGGGGGG